MPTPKSTLTKPLAVPPGGERIVDVDVSEEMRGSFLEYAYSVIYSRALPDARDGLKPVQRRILYQMSQMGLRPERGHVKCARVVGEVMGRLHPHGDSAIYDALVRMAQPFALRLPFVDGHGNFGSLDDGPAAMRYTECRLAPAAYTMTESLDEDVVDFIPNYDGREREPVVLPAAVPALLVNGAAGIAVGMATNMAPHNLGEVCRAAALLVSGKNVGLDEVMRHVPGPDFPTGGLLLGLAGVREAYATGRGGFRIRATTSIEQVSARRQGIVVTSLPFNVGPERVTERIKELVTAKKIDGIADLVDLTDGEQGLRLVIEIKSGFSVEAVREALFRLTPLEETFNINNVALVDGQPRTLGLVELLRVFVDHRIEVVTRRCQFRRAKAERRLHLVEGLLIAVLDIDQVVAVIRSSDDAGVARQRLMEVFELSEAQSTHILDMPLRRLTKYSVIELQTEQNSLTATISELTGILDDEVVLRSMVRAELLETASRFDSPRRTVLLDCSEAPAPAPKAKAKAAAAAVSLELADEACLVGLSSSGKLAQVAQVAQVESGGQPGHVGQDAAAGVPFKSRLITSTRSEIGLITSTGVVHRIMAMDLPKLAGDNRSGEGDAWGTPAGEYVSLSPGEQPVALVPLGNQTPIAIGTATGIVKRVLPEALRGRSEYELISLKPGDEVVGAGTAPDDLTLVFITSDGQLLLFKAETVRSQGRTATGMAGIKLAPDARAICFAAVAPAESMLVATAAGSADQLSGIGQCSFKVSRFSDYPAKGRATGGVRCHRFTKGEDVLMLAVVAARIVALSASGKRIELPTELARRDASGSKLPNGVAMLGAGF